MTSIFSVLLVGLLAPTVNITWDTGLAFERDRAAYEVLLRDIVIEAYTTQSKLFGLELPKVSIVIHTPASYTKAYGVGSSAHYRRKAIHVKNGQRLGGRFISVMHHEMVHAFVDFQGTSRVVPTWLNEGLAEAAERVIRGSSELAPSERQSLMLQAKAGTLPELVKRGRLNHQGYLLSWAAVQFIDSRGGPGTARRVVLAMVKDGKSLRDALRSVATIDLISFEQDFASWLRDS